MRLVSGDRDLGSEYIVGDWGMSHCDFDYVKPGMPGITVMIVKSRMLLVFGCGCGDGKGCEKACSGE